MLPIVERLACLSQDALNALFLKIDRRKYELTSNLREGKVGRSISVQA
jgi:hypothetical protein